MDLLPVDSTRGASPSDCPKNRVQPISPEIAAGLRSTNSLPYSRPRVRDLPALHPHHRMHSPNLPNLTSVSRSATWVNRNGPQPAAQFALRRERGASDPRIRSISSMGFSPGPFLAVILAQPESPYLSCLRARLQPCRRGRNYNWALAPEDSRSLQSRLCSQPLYPCLNFHLHPTPAIRYTGSPCPLRPIP